MKILIWKSHDEISVYDVSTPEKLKVCIEVAMDCIDCDQDQGLLEQVQQHIEKHADNLEQLTRAFNSIRNAVTSDRYMFEQFYIGELE
jgi:uncharacterized protein (DUF342 family)